MRKHGIRVLLSVIMALALCFAFAACDGTEPKPDYGTLTVQNLTIEEGDTAAISATFSKADKAEAITYTFEGNDISIANGIVTALVGGKTVTVTAKTEHHEATFTVTTTVDYGTLTLADLTLEEGEEKALAPVFSKVDKAEAITYTFEGNDIKIEDGKVTALVGGKTVTVTAKTEHHTATFTVNTTVVDYGTLTIADITGLKTTSNRAKILPVFSNPDKKEEITYTFEGNDIKIEDGFVTALVGGKTVTVTAKTAHHETTFKVITLVDYGTLVIDDVTAWVGYPASEIDMEFSIPEMKEKLTFTYDKSKITLDEEKMTVKALAKGDVIVEASSEHFLAEFIVSCETVDKTTGKYNTANFDSYAQTLKNKWANDGVDGKTTLFIGDSFFDVRYFWTNFYTTFAGKDALCCGISATTTYDWEVFTESFLKYTNPKNIVMHMGTNNVYDDGDSAQVAINSLKRMFYVIHEALPETKIYWFNISQRSYGNSEIATVSSVNPVMAEWCSNRDWITCIDTSSKLTPAMLKDSVHPKLEYYSVFTDALAKSDIVIEDAAIKEGLDFKAATEGNVTFSAATATFTGEAVNGKRMRAYMQDGVSAYVGNFMVSGKASLTNGTGTNPWIELIVNNAENDGWFSAQAALPASAICFSSGKVQAWGHYGAGQGEIASPGTTFEFTVIAYNKSLLFKIGDQVKAYTDDGLTGTIFGFGAENATIKVENFKAIIKDDVTIGNKYNELAPTPSLSIADLVRDKGQKIGAGAVDVTFNGKLLNRNYVLEGKLDVTDAGNNPHAHFKFDGDGNRILLWDNQTNGNYKVGYAVGGKYENNAPSHAIYKFTAGQTLTLAWKLVVTDNDAYFYVNGALKFVWKNIPGNKVTLSTENISGKFYEMKAVTKADTLDDYNAAIALVKADIDASHTTGYIQ